MSEVPLYTRCFKGHGFIDRPLPDHMCANPTNPQTRSNLKPDQTPNPIKPQTRSNLKPE